MDRVSNHCVLKIQLTLLAAFVSLPSSLALGQVPNQLGTPGFRVPGSSTQLPPSNLEMIPPGSVNGQPAGSLPGTSESLPPPAAAVDLSQNQKVADVQIIGNESTDIDKILQLIRTRKDRNFDPELVQQDKRALLTKGLFRDVRVTTLYTEHGVLVTFEVFERPTIRYVEFIGDRGVSAKSLLKETGLKIGDAMNFYAVEEARRKIEELYRRKGYAKIQVTISEGNRPEDRGVVFIISEGPLQRIWSVAFIGNDETVIPDGRLKTQIESKPGFLKVFGGKVDHEKIASDIAKLTVYYRGLGYFGARIGRQIEYDEKQKWLTIKFVIDEGPRYVVRNVAVIGNQQFSSDQLQTGLQLRSGEFFNLDRMNGDVSAIRDQYGGQGYIFADIKADPRFLEEPGEIDLVYNISEGQQFRVGRINVKIAGEFPHTKERVILDRLSIRPGQIVDIREVRNSERRLKASQLFMVNPSEGEPPRIVIVPPDLKDTDEFLAGNGTGTTRGQSPDDETQTIDLDVRLPDTFWDSLRGSFWPW